MKFATVEVLLILMITTSCSDPSEIGVSFFQEGSLNLVYADTTAVQVSTVIVDSIQTSAATRLLIGYHDDDKLGDVLCKTYFSMGPLNNTASLKDLDSEYSRLSLILSYDTYSYYDTTISQSLHVHRLFKNIDNDYSLGAYNTSSLPYDPEQLGSINFTPYPHRIDSIEIPLSDELGRQLYELSKNASEQILNSTEFLKLLKGFVVVPDTNISASILGFKTDPQLRLYYIDRSIRPVDEKYISYSVSSSANTTKYFNSITNNRSATRLANLKTLRYPVSSLSTDNEAYVQGGTGFEIRVDMPYIKSILQDDQNLIISSAFLKVRPIHNSWRLNAALPGDIVVNNVNEQNQNLGSYGTMTFVADEYLDRDSYYILDVETYIKQQLAITENNQNALILKFGDGDMASTVNRLYIGDQHNDDRMEIMLYVVAVKTE